MKNGIFENNKANKGGQISMIKVIDSVIQDYEFKGGKADSLGGSMYI